MHTPLATRCLLLVLCGSLSSCAYISNEASADYTTIQSQNSSTSYPYEHQRSPYEGYGHPTNSIYFGHDAAIGYGGVNVYGYQGV